MKKSRENIFNKVKKEKLLESENVEKSKVLASKNKYKKMQEPPKEYVEAHEDVDREDLITKLFFLESQMYYLEKALDTEKERNKED